MIRSIYETYDKYNVLLNKYYKRLYSEIVNQKSLFKAKRAWYEFIGKEIEFFKYELAGDTKLVNLSTLERVLIA